MADFRSKSDQPDLKPVEIRNIFGANLRQMSGTYPSIAGLCRELGINRTQYNRYLSGESFPRPDVLHRICQFFGTDARILLEPVDKIRPGGNDLLHHPVISQYIGRSATQVEEDEFPSGFYRFTRISFTDGSKAVLGLIYIMRSDGYTFLRGFEPREAMRQQGLPENNFTREFRGIVLTQEAGVAALVARKGAVTCSFNFLAKVATYNDNYWEGYTTRTIRESISGPRVARLVYEYLGKDTHLVLDSARRAGIIEASEVPTFHARLLRLNDPFH